MFSSQAAGSANTFTGYFFAPLSQGQQGEVLFIDAAANLNLGNNLTQDSAVSAGASSRLGYRWLSFDRGWIFGINAGIDTRKAYSQYAFQAGVGAEALSRSLEIRANGYIPFANQADLYQSGYSNAYLANNQLILDGWNRYVVSLGGLNLEAGIPVSRWKHDSLWLYGSYYYLSGNYLSGSSGVRARGELRLGSRFALGASVSYDSIFETQAMGYIRYGTKPLAGNAKDAVDVAESNFFALRGLPMQRDVDIRMVSAQQNLPGSVATNPGVGANWVVRCTGSTTTTGTAAVNCANPTLDSLLAAAGPGDVLLVGGGASSDLAGKTRLLASGTNLVSSGNSPSLNTQFGLVNLNPIFGSRIGSVPTISNGTISIGSNTAIVGLNFSDLSLTNHSTSNVLIANNTFTGSYTDNPTDLAVAREFGPINVSAKALPAIQFDGVDNLTISNNIFLYPQVQTYVSQYGTNNGGPNPLQVCNQNGLNTTGLCLSANAIRLNNSTDVVLSGNSVNGALDEAFRINNPSGTLLIVGNSITNMRMGPDSNIGSAIIVGQNRGISSIEISNNTFTHNSPGIYPVVNGPSASVAPAPRGKNVIDPIEVGLCRGTDSYPRAQDLYADAGFSGNCSSPATMNIVVSKNTINLPDIAGGIAQDGDGIDFNLGSNSILNATVSGNRTLTLGGTGDNGITFDLRGNSQTKAIVANNSVNDASDEAIDFSLGNALVNNQQGYAEISLVDNIFSGTTKGLLNIDMIKNPGLPLSNFYVSGLGDNFANVQSYQPNGQPFNTGNYANIYLNGVLTKPKF